MSKYIMALDQGTSSSRTIIYNERFETVAVSQKEFTQIYKNDSWVEHDPMEIWETQLSTAKAALAESGVSPFDIAAIGITNQRETTVVWDKNTGKPVYNAIVWMCKRTSDYCSALKEQGWSEKIKAKTGLPIDSYFSATKIRWILHNVDGALEKAKNGDLLFGTIDCWLLYNLTEGKVHATDYTNASRTMIFNIHTGEYDGELLDLFGIPRSMLPEVFPNSCEFGRTTLFGGDIMIGGMAGDQQSSLFGHGCFFPGMAKNTYGTGCFTLVNTGDLPIESEHGLITTVAINLDGKTHYALEGSVFNAGSTVKWLRDEMGLITSASETESIAKSVDDTNGVYLVPAFTGLGAPYWDMYARGTIIGITRKTNRAHIVRAVLEAIVFETADVLQAMSLDMGRSLDSLEVDGGACANNFMMQMQADIMNCAVLRPKDIEATARGAAYLAALASGVVTSLDDLSGLTSIDMKFLPLMDNKKRTALLAGWKKAVSRSLNWAE